MFKIPICGIPTIKKRHSYFIFAITLFVAGIIPLYSATEWNVLMAVLAYMGIGFIVILLVVFCPERIPSPKKAFKDTDVIWGMWFSGRERLEEGLIDKYHSKIKKLLLLNPEKMEGSEVHDITSQIEALELTQKAQDLNICIKWSNEKVPHTFTFYYRKNSFLKKTWLLWRGGKSDEPYDDWRKHKYRKHKYNKGHTTFTRSLEQFNNVWKYRSEKPSRERVVEMLKKIRKDEASEQGVARVWRDEGYQLGTGIKADSERKRNT